MISVGKSPTEAFISAELQTSRPSSGISKLEVPEVNDYALR